MLNGPFATIHLLKTSADTARIEQDPSEQPDRFEAIELENLQQNQTLSTLSQLSPPIGSIIAFAGEWPPKKTDGEAWSEEQLGWMLCDGRPLKKSDYLDLFHAIGISNGNGTLDPRPTTDNPTAVADCDFNLPDLRGLFLRGVDKGIGRDPDSNKRSASIVGGNDADAVGSRQEWATAVPRAGLITGEDGKHNHFDQTRQNIVRTEGNQRFTIDKPMYNILLRLNTAREQVNNTLGAPQDDTDKEPVIDGGGDVGELQWHEGHTHTIPSYQHDKETYDAYRARYRGDVETRPSNVAVHWIIKTSAIKTGAFASR